jgi:NAD(P)-dependent dehydrogenase (short-subunit alcohol dehydrogenase family)
LTALVTGGSSGLGRGVSKLLHQNGANVAVLDLPVSKGKEFVDELGKNAIFTPADVSEFCWFKILLVKVTNEEQIAKAMENIKSNFGQLDAVVNCAGIAFAFRLYNSNKRAMGDFDRYKKTLDVNFVF